MLAGAISAYSQSPAQQQAEGSGKLGADLGATLFQAGELRDGTSTYIALGYATVQSEGVDRRDPSKTPGATMMGDFSLRIGNFCASEVTAQVVPVGLYASNASEKAENSIFITGVKVTTDDAGKDKCNSPIHVSYSAKLPDDAKLTQIAYTVFLKGKKTPDGEPTVLPLMPL